MPAEVGFNEHETAMTDAFAVEELADVQPVIDAVCRELGVTAKEKARRDAVAKRVMAAYRGGTRQPLDMVHAGLAEQTMASRQV